MKVKTILAPALALVLSVTALAGCAHDKKDEGNQSGDHNVVLEDETQSEDKTQSGEGTEKDGSVGAREDLITDMEGFWIVTAIADKDGHEINMKTPGEDTPYLQVTDEGYAGGFAGCNEFQAEIRGGDHIFGPVTTTRMMCEDDQMKVEDSLLKILDTADLVKRDGETLSITDKEGATAELTLIPEMEDVEPGSGH